MLEATLSSLQSKSSSATSAKTSPTSLPLYYFTQITYNRPHSASLVDHNHKRVRVLGNCDVYVVGKHLAHALVCLCELRLRYHGGKFVLADQHIWTALHHCINRWCLFDIRFLYNNFIIHSFHIYNSNRNTSTMKLIFIFVCFTVAVHSVSIIKRFEAGENFCFSDDVRTFCSIQHNTLSSNSKLESKPPFNSKFTL
jgi:hypothetical protein